MWLKTQLFDLFYVSCSFKLVVCGGKNISPNSKEPEPQGAAFFWSLRAGDEAGASWEKKWGAGKKLAGSPALLYLIRII